MSADFWAGYISGAIGILIGNPLDIIKTKAQAGFPKATPDVAINHSPEAQKPLNRWTQFARGAAAPILGYGALNALMFVTYNRTLSYFNTGNFHTLPQDFAQQPSALSIWTAGALGGLATFIVSAPTELIKCRAQVINPSKSSLSIAKHLFTSGGLRGLYMGGSITALRDSVGYGFYFWSYELSKRSLSNPSDSHAQEATKVLFCGGLAGVITWASIFPLDVIKTRVQTWDLSVPHTADGREAQALLGGESARGSVLRKPSSLEVARRVYQNEGAGVFFRGLGVCSARAFIVNAVQWAVYEWTMKALTTS